MAIGKRVTRLMKAYLNYHWERIRTLIEEESTEAEARAHALKELEQSQPPLAPQSPHNPSLGSTVPTHPQASAGASEVARAYRTLGLPEGADLATVRRTYRELTTRANPERFPEGSEERAKAEQIRSHIERAYQLLLKQLDPSGHRFRHLDIE